MLDDHNNRSQKKKRNRQRDRLRTKRTWYYIASSHPTRYLEAVESIVSAPPDLPCFRRHRFCGTRDVGVGVGVGVRRVDSTRVLSSGLSVGRKSFFLKLLMSYECVCIFILSSILFFFYFWVQVLGLGNLLNILCPGQISVRVYIPLKSYKMICFNIHAWISAYI